MNELSAGKEIVNGMSSSALKFAEAAGDIGALKVIFGVFMIMMLVVMVMFVYQVFITNKRLGKVEEAAERTLTYFTPLSNRTIGGEEAKAIIRESVSKTSTMIKYGILKIRYENHLTPGSADDRIKGAVKSEHNDRRALLGRFFVKSRKLSFVVEDNDDTAMIELMKKFVYMDEDKFTASLMAQEVNWLLDGVKACYQRKIDELE